jgi:hypothetical protein
MKNSNADLIVESPVFSISVFRYRKVSFYCPNIDTVLFYKKYADINIDPQYQEIILIYWYFQYFSVSLHLKALTWSPIKFDFFSLME